MHRFLKAYSTLSSTKDGVIDLLLAILFKENG